MNEGGTNRRRGMSAGSQAVFAIRSRSQSHSLGPCWTCSNSPQDEALQGGFGPSDPTDEKPFVVTEQDTGHVIYYLSSPTVVGTDVALAHVHVSFDPSADLNALSATVLSVVPLTERITSSQA